MGWGHLMYRVVLFCLLMLAPAAVQAQDYDEYYGYYDDAETMRADQAIVSDLLNTGTNALEAGNWQAALRNCRELYSHLDQSPFMREQVNKDAFKIAARCYADAQAMLGNAEEACLAYTEVDYDPLLDIDTSALCRNTANPAPLSDEERIRGQYDRMRANLVTMNDLVGVLNKLSDDDPSKSAKIAELRAVCSALPIYTSYYATVTKGFAKFCEGQAYSHEDNEAGFCEATREADAAFTQLGMPLPPSTPHVDFVEGIKKAVEYGMGTCPK